MGFLRENDFFICGEGKSDSKFEKDMRWFGWFEDGGGYRRSVGDL